MGLQSVRGSILEETALGHLGEDNGHGVNVLLGVSLQDMQALKTGKMIKCWYAPKCVQNISASKQSMQYSCNSTYYKHHQVSFGIPILHVIRANTHLKKCNI